MRRMKEGGVFAISMVAILFANLVLMGIHSAGKRIPSAPPSFPAPVAGEMLTPETLLPLLPRCWNQGLR